ncbi:MAG: hypothetical protein NXI00_22500 [Cytophagales bacterium]|nr:hypothetical protein [Cytophagales bacterium]
MDKNNLAELEVSFRANPDGVYHRSPSPIHVVPSYTYQETEEGEQKFKNAISKIIEAKEAAKSQEKKVAIVEKYINSHLFHLAAIGGVHSNTVYRRLIKAVDAPEFNRDFKYGVDLYCGLSYEEFLLIAKKDNEIKVGRNETLADKAIQIRECFRSARFQDLDRIDNNFIDYRIENYILKTDEWKKLDDKGKTKKRREKRNLVRASIWPDSLNPLISSALREGLLTQTQLTSIYYWMPHDKIETALKNLITSHDKRAFEKEITTIKLRVIFDASIVRAFEFEKTINAELTNFSDDEFLEKFYECFNLNFLAIKFKKQTNLKGSRKKDQDVDQPPRPFTDTGLNGFVKTVVKKCLSTDKHDDDVIVAQNHEKQESEHCFIQDLADKGLLTVSSVLTQEEHSNCGMIFLDPPFGVLAGESWDEVWQMEYVNRVLSLCLSLFSDATLIIFVSQEMLSSWYGAATSCGYVVNIFAWQKPFNVPNPMTLNHSCNFILVCANTKLTCQHNRWIKESKSVHQLH